MINREHDLPFTRQARLLKHSRGSLHYQPEPVSAEDLDLMRRIDKLHLLCPFCNWPRSSATYPRPAS